MIRVAPLVGYEDDIGGALCLACAVDIPDKSRPLYAPAPNCCECHVDIVALAMSLPSLADVRPDLVGRR